MATFAGFECYTGATMSRVVDGAGAVWRGCCMQRTGHKETFGFYITRNGVEVSYAPFCTARGQVTQDGWWTAWEGAQYYEGPLPGFVPIARAPVPIPPSGAIANLWPYPYTAAECDTPEKIAVKLTKSNAAILELVELLKRAGVVG